MVTLTHEDHMRMHQQGWCVCLPFGGFRIERIPASRLFKDDACAWLHVFDLALEREPVAFKALQFLQANEPDEFALLARYVAIYRPQQVAHLRAAA